MFGRVLLNLIAAVSIVLAALATGVHADDQGDAAQIAGKVLNLLNEKKYDEIWEQHLSPMYKERTTKAAFLANFTLGRLSIQPITQSKPVGTEFNLGDPAFGFTGKMFSITFLNTYGSQKLYEKLVIVQDADAAYRLGGMWAAPAP